MVLLAARFEKSREPLDWDMMFELLLFCIEHVHQITWLSCLLFLSLIFLCIRRTAFAGSAYYGIFLLVLQFLVITLNTLQLSGLFALPTHLL